METVGGFENLRNLAVQFTDDFVDGLLPRRIHVFTGHDGVEELSERDLGDLQKAVRHLEVVGLVVVHVEGPEQLTVAADAELVRTGHPVVDGLPGELLHLDVVELPEVTEPLDQLRRDAAVELYIREVHL